MRYFQVTIGSVNLKKLWQPSALVAWLLLLLPFERIPSVKLAGVTLRLSMVAGLALIATVAWQRRGQLKAWLKYWPVRWLGGYVFVLLLASLASLHPGRSFEILSFDLYVFLIALTVADTLKLQDLGRYKKWLLIGAGITLVIGAWQFFGDLLGLSIRLTGLRPAYTKDIFGFPRIQSTALEPLYFANYLILPFSILAALSLTTAVPALLLIAFLTESFMTVSRGGDAAILVIVAIVSGYGLWRRWWQPAARLLAALLVGAGLAVLLITALVPFIGQLQKAGQRQVQAGQNYQKQVTNYEVGDNMSDRAKTRMLGLQLFKAHPILGAGPGGFGYYAHEQAPGYGTSQTVNNLPIEVLAETGLLGFVTLVGFALSLFWLALKAFWKAPDRSVEKAWILGLLAFLVATAGQYQTFSTLYITHIWVAIGLLLGLSATVLTAKPARRSRKKKS